MVCQDIVTPVDCASKTHSHFFKHAFLSNMLFFQTCFLSNMLPFKHASFQTCFLSNMLSFQTCFLSNMLPFKHAFLSNMLPFKHASFQTCFLSNMLPFKHASSSKKSVAYRHSGLRPGIQCMQPRFFIDKCFLDSGSKPGMTVCHRLLRRRSMFRRGKLEFKLIADIYIIF